MANFQDILSKPSASIEAPSALPAGTYLCIIDGQPEFVKVGKNQTDAVKVVLKPVQAQPDVDQEALQKALVVNGAVSALQDKKINQNYFITEAAVWRLKDFLDNCGVDEGTKTLGERIPDLMGKQVLISLGHRSSDDGKQVFNEVKGSAKV